MRLDDFWACQKAIVQVANRIAVVASLPLTGMAPAPQLDVTEHWAASFAPDAGLAPLVENREQQNEEREAWSLGLFDRPCLESVLATLAAPG